MLGWLRKAMVWVAIVALATVGGVTPRHANALTNQHATSAHDHQAVSTADEQLDHQNKATPDLGCCVASCSAIALIFAAYDVSHGSPRPAFVSAPATALPSVLPFSIDRPPRLA